MCVASAPVRRVVIKGEFLFPKGRLVIYTLAVLADHVADPATVLTVVATHKATASNTTGKHTHRTPRAKHIALMPWYLNQTPIVFRITLSVATLV